MTRAGVFGKWRACDRESVGLVGQLIDDGPPKPERPGEADRGSLHD
jgi:hypothetical protein